jgi:putative flippase GtrA
MINEKIKDIIIWIANFILLFISIIVGMAITCSAVYFPLKWLNWSGEYPATICIGVLYTMIIIIKLIAEAME